MRSIWVRAGIGALAVFTVGMGLYYAARATKARAVTALGEFKAELDSGTVAAFEKVDRATPFVLDGQRLGRLASLDLTPDAPAGSPALSAVVLLDPAHTDPGMLSTCTLVPMHPDSFGDIQEFRCAGAGESGLKPLGQVTFQPVGVTRPVKASPQAVVALRRQGTLTIDSSHRGVHLNATGDSGEVVSINADSNGAFIHVRDGKGKVVRLAADKNGLVVKVDSTTTR